MIVAATDSNGIFLGQSQAGNRFAGIQYAHIATNSETGVLSGQGSGSR